MTKGGPVEFSFTKFMVWLLSHNKGGRLNSKDAHENDQLWLTVLFNSGSEKGFLSYQLTFPHQFICSSSAVNFSHLVLSLPSCSARNPVGLVSVPTFTHICWISLSVWLHWTDKVFFPPELPKGTYTWPPASLGL